MGNGRASEGSLRTESVRSRLSSILTAGEVMDEREKRRSSVLKLRARFSLCKKRKNKKRNPHVSQDCRGNVASIATTEAVVWSR